MNDCHEDFWNALDELVNTSEIVIDRPKGSAHPRFPGFIYPVDYGYLKNTTSMDGAGIDVWVGSGEKKTDAIMCIVDLMKRDSEIKILIGCTEEEKTEICGGKQNMHYNLVPLPKDQWKGTAIPMITGSDSYYDFEISPLNSEGCTVSIVRKPAEKEIVHTPEEYDFPDSLYQDHWEGAEAYGIVSDAGEIMACLEVCPEEWSNRLMVTELWVSEELRGKGIGKMLMDKAKEVAVRQKRRAIILETQSHNTNAIGFYLHQGFELIGFDTCCYTNNDIGRREVRINLGYFFHREGRRR